MGNLPSHHKAKHAKHQGGECKQADQASQRSRFVDFRVRAHLSAVANRRRVVDLLKRENQPHTRQAKEILEHSAPVKQSIVTLDLEGVLVPEIWIAVAEKTGIKELRRTTREEPDYDKLMRGRLKILDQHGLKLSDIQQVIGTLRPLP